MLLDQEKIRHRILYFRDALRQKFLISVPADQVRRLTNGCCATQTLEKSQLKMPIRGRISADSLLR